MARSRRGRQAEARRNDRAVLDAARVVFAVHGPDAPVSAVAAEAGVGMGSLYRRYASKEELLQSLCQASMEQQIAAAGAALAGSDGPWDALAGFIRACVSFRAGVFSSVAGTIPVTAEMSATARHAHELLERLVVQASRAGSLRQDVSSVDIYQLIELFSRRRPDDEGAYQRLLAIALDGLRAPGREPSGLMETTLLPGSTPTWESYARRWVGRSAGDRELPS
jgi:AcrR family transcriptional regulator